MTCLEQQLDELDLLQSVFSQPGEYDTDQATVDRATAWVQRLTAESPTNRLSCTLHLTVDAMHCELEDNTSATDDASSLDRSAVQCTVNISMTLPHG